MGTRAWCSRTWWFSNARIRAGGSVRGGLILRLTFRDGTKDQASDAELRMGKLEIPGSRFARPRRPGLRAGTHTARSLDRRDVPVPSVTKNPVVKKSVAMGPGG